MVEVVNPLIDGQCQEVLVLILEEQGDVSHLQTAHK